VDDFHVGPGRREVQVEDNIVNFWRTSILTGDMEVKAEMTKEMTAVGLDPHHRTLIRPFIVQQ
jgi:hypothetical protein